MNKRTVAIGSALILGLGIYIGSQTSSLSTAQRDELIMRSKDLIRKLNRRNYEACISTFSPSFSESVGVAKLRDIFDPTLDTLGEFYRFRGSSIAKKELPAKELPIGGGSDNSGDSPQSFEYLSCTVHCEYKNGPATYTIFFDQNHKVSGIYLD